MTPLAQVPSVLDCCRIFGPVNNDELTMRVPLSAEQLWGEVARGLSWKLIERTSEGLDVTTLGRQAFKSAHRPRWLANFRNRDRKCTGA